MIPSDARMPASNVSDDIWVVVPAFNEARVIRSVLTGLRSVYPNIVVIDDGSSDETAREAAAASVTVLRHALNLGQGAALQTGIEYCLIKNAPFICTFDADGQHAVESINVLYDHLRRADADVAIGSRMLGNTINMPTVKKLLLKLATWFTRIHTSLPVTDTHNGLRLFTNTAARKIHIRQSGMAHASEILLQIKSEKLKFVEAPVCVEYTAYSISKGQPLSNAFRILKELLVASWRR